MWYGHVIDEWNHIIITLMVQLLYITEKKTENSDRKRSEGSLKASIHEDRKILQRYDETIL